MFEMPGCGHCMRAKRAISDYKGPLKFKVKSFKKAPQHVKGFPHFVASNGKEVSGFGGSLDKIAKDLGIVEGYCCQSKEYNRKAAIGNPASIGVM